MSSILSIPPTKDLMLNICADTVQTDAGENKNAIDKRHLLVAHKDIEPYLIVGVKAEDVTIICTSKRLLLWFSK